MCFFGTDAITNIQTNIEKKTVSITCTGLAKCGNIFTTVATQSLEFDASKYTFCYASGSYAFRGGSGSTSTITVQKDDLVYNVGGPEHYATEQGWWTSRLMFDSSSFNIQLKYTNGNNLNGLVSSCNITAMFYN